MKIAPPPFQDLDFKAAKRLIQSGYTTREQVLEAVAAGRLSLIARERPRQYGRILHRRVRLWLGLPAEDPLLSDDWLRRRTTSACPPRPPSFTPQQGQYLAFIYYYAKVNGRAPAEADFERYFRVSPSFIHRMIEFLEKAGWIARAPGPSRSIALKLMRDQLPDLR